jgi:hypothetical protein
MAIKKIEQVKADKGFKIFDLVAYAVIIVAILIMFIAFVFTADKSALTTVKISFIKNWETVTVFTYDFDSGEYNVLSAENIEICEETEERITLYFYVDESKNEYNEIVIDKSEKCVWVEDANCNNKTCKSFGKLKTKNQVITCSPHGYMVIEPNDYKVSGSEII